MKIESLKIPISILLSALATFAIGLYGELPWWSFAVANFIIALAIPLKPWVNFLTGAFGVASIWTGLATSIDAANNHILSTKVATILPLNGSYTSLIVITTLVGALVGGFASLTGAYLRKK